MMPLGRAPERPETPPTTDHRCDTGNGGGPSEGTSKAVGAPARAWQLLQVRVSREVWAWTHRLAILTRSNPGEVVEKAIHALARIESQEWPEEDLPRLGRYRRRHTLVYEPFTKRVIGKRRIG